MKTFCGTKLVSRGVAVVLMALASYLFPQNCFSQAPEIEWQKTFGGTSNDEAEKIIQTSDGGYLMAGFSYSNDGDAAGNHGPGNSDGWIIKMDPMGNIQWRKMIGGTQWEDFLSIQETQNGGYIVAGHSYSDDGNLASNSGGSDALVIKLDLSGNIEWLKTYGGSDEDVILSIVDTPDGGYICVGHTGSWNLNIPGYHGDYDVWVMKLDNTGNIQWQKCIGGTGRDLPWQIIPAQGGGYVFTGHTNSTDGDIALNHGQYDIMAGKLDAAGNILWVKTFGGSLAEMSNSIVPASDGGYVIAGYAFSGDGDVGINYGMNDVWIIKISEQGNLLWKKTFGGSNYEDPYYITQTNDGGYVVAGRTRSDNGHVSVHRGNNDYWILKLDPSGNLQWEKTVGGSEQDVAHSIQQTLDGGYIVSGTTYSSDGDVSSIAGKSDAWIVKLGVCTLSTPADPVITGTNTPCTGTAITYSVAAVNEATGYTWVVPDRWITSGQTTTTITVMPANNAGEISVIAYNSCKKSGKTILAVTPVNATTPQVTIRSNTGNNICQGTEIVFTADVGGVTAPVYQWKKNGVNTGTDANIYRDNNLKNGDIITCQVTTATACAGQVIVISPAITMSVSPLAMPAITISSNTTSICKGSAVTFNAAVADQGPNPIYRWYVNSTDAGTNLPDFTSNSLQNGDVVYCRLLSNDVCAVNPNAESNHITISVDENTEATATITSSVTTLCKNDEVLFNAAIGNGGTSPAYQWTVNGIPAGSNSPVFSTSNLSDKDQVACMIIPGSNTCAVNAAVSNTIQVTINPLPQLEIYPADTLVKPGTQLQYDVYISEPTRSFAWSPAAKLVVPSLLEPITVPIFDPVTYRLSITTKDGCPMYKEVSIKPLISLYMPTAFTPGADGLNDLFRIPPGTDLALTEFSIYNAWGEKIFTTKDITAGWDGRVKGVSQSTGVFVYTITGVQNSKPVFLRGAFTLIR